MLGDRIRKIRKQKKLTLEAVAGRELSKGMLSLIENNKAKPSMESLAFIAGQLKVEVSDLLGEVSTDELREILEPAEKIYNTPVTELANKYRQLVELLSPHIGKLSHGYESARLLEIYSYALQQDKKPGWEDLINKAADMFDQMNISSNRASIGIFRSSIAFVEHDYKKALEIFQAERKEIEAKHNYIEPLARLDLDYHEAIFLYAVGAVKAAMETTEKALAFSKDKRIFYRMDDMYRLAVAHALMEGNVTEKDYYLQKLKQYGEFAEDNMARYSYQLFHIFSLIQEKHDYAEALEKIEENLADPEMVEFFHPWFLLEKAKSLYYLGRYHEAMETIEKVQMPDIIHHPIDLSDFYLKESYKALILTELGRKEEAIAAAQTAVDNFHPLPDSKLKKFSSEVLEKLK